MIDRVTKYALDVVEGRVVAGELAILACQRHLNDIEKSKSDSFIYKFDVEKANRIIEFAETLQIAEGDDEERGPLKLRPFQDFILGPYGAGLEKIQVIGDLEVVMSS